MAFISFYNVQTIVFFSLLLLPSEHSLLSKNILNFNFINKYSNVCQALQLAYCKCSKFYALLSSVLQVTHWRASCFFACFVFFSLLRFLAFYFTHSQRVQCSLLIAQFVGSSELCARRDWFYVYLLLITYCYEIVRPREQNLASSLVGWSISFYFVVVFCFQFLFLHM